MNAGPLSDLPLGRLRPLTRRTRRLRLGLPSGTSPATPTAVPLAPELRDSVSARRALNRFGLVDLGPPLIRALPPGYFPL